MRCCWRLLRWWQVTPDPVSRLAQRAKHVIDVPTDTGRYLLANGVGAGLFNRGQVVAELIDTQAFYEEVMATHEPLLVGAMARDLLLHYGRDVTIARATTDIDLAFANAQ